MGDRVDVLHVDSSGGTSEETVLVADARVLAVGGSAGSSDQRTVMVETTPEDSLRIQNALVELPGDIHARVIDGD